MHELAVTEKILDIVLKHAHQNRVKRILSVTLKIGDLSDLENEWIQHYFNYLSKDTVAANAVLKIEKVPIVLRCNKCSQNVEVSKDKIGDIACPNCKEEKNFSLVSGREYFIKEMEAE